jgi:hypothetical protein
VRESIGVEGLLRWAYARQQVHLLDAGVGLYEGERAAAEAERHDVSRDGVAACMRHGPLGAVIPTTGWGAAGNVPDVHRDAIVVAEALKLAANRFERLTVEFHARTETRPEAYARLTYRWRPAETKPRQGAETPVYDYDPDYRGGKVPFYCRLACDPDPDRVRVRRQRYADWVACLGRLDAWFRDDPSTLQRFRVDGSLPPAAPWTKGLDGCGSSLT